VRVAWLVAGPLSIARAHRARTARTPLAVTDLPVTDVAFAAGFGSLRQFNDTIAELYRTTPSGLRALARRGAAADESGTISLRLPARAPFDAAGVFGFFADHAVPGLEEAGDGRLARPIRLPAGGATIDVRPDPERPGVVLLARLDRLADLPALTARVRRMFDLDADAVAIDTALARDSDLEPLVARVPGIRIAGSPDPEEA